ncbi:MAG: hypothetical protein ABW166_14420 [Sedimenticola sp.]
MGTQIMAGMIIQPDVRIGQSCIINTGAIVDHECAIQDNSHLATPVTLSGNIVGSKVTHIGAGVSVRQGISIGHACIVAEGSIIHKDIPVNTKYIQPHEERLWSMA